MNPLYPTLSTYNDPCLFEKVEIFEQLSKWTNSTSCQVKIKIRDLHENLPFKLSSWLLTFDFPPGSI